MIEVDKMGIMMLKKFVKYVSQNMLGMVGMSVYILADTYFISVAVGEYYGAAEPPVRCGESHLSGLTEPLRSL